MSQAAALARIFGFACYRITHVLYVIQKPKKSLKNIRFLFRLFGIYYTYCIGNCETQGLSEFHAQFDNYEKAIFS